MTLEIGGLLVERARVRTTALLFMAIAVMMVLFAVAVRIGWLATERQVQVELARIRAAGEPVTPADLEAFYTLPANSVDTTALWLMAAEAVTQPGYEKDAQPFALFPDSLPPGEPWPQQFEAERFLFKYAGLVDALHEASAIGGAARYPTRFSDGVMMSADPPWRLRSATRLLRLESEINARNGDAHAAVDSIRAIFALARSLQREPLLSTQLVRKAHNDAAVASFERLLATVRVPDDDLAQIDDDLATINYYESLHRAMLGERVLGLQTFGRPDTLDDKAPPVIVGGIFRQGDLAVYLQLMGEFIAASKANDHSALRNAMDMAHQAAADVASASSVRWRYPMTVLLVPSLQGFIDAIGRGTARRDIARTAIAIERFRRSRGSLPRLLDDLVPEFAKKVPSDPFSGGPLRLRIANDEFRIYSIGPDGIDQAGDAPELGNSGDIVFRVRRRKVGATTSNDE